MRAAGHQHVEVFGERLHVWLTTATTEPDAHQHLAALITRAGLAPFDGRIITPSLEDVFIARLAELETAAPAGTAS
jgi:hypothetical protein